MSWDYTLFEVYCGLVLKRASCGKFAPFEWDKKQKKFVRTGPWKGGKRFTVKFKCPLTPKEEGCSKCFTAIKVKSRGGTVACPWVSFADLTQEFHDLNMCETLWRKQGRAERRYERILRSRTEEKLPNMTSKEAKEMWRVCCQYVGNKKRSGIEKGMKNDKS